MGLFSKFKLDVDGWLEEHPCERCKITEDECWGLVRCDKYEEWYKKKPKHKGE